VTHQNKRGDRHEETQYFNLQQAQLHDTDFAQGEWSAVDSPSVSVLFVTLVFSSPHAWADPNVYVANTADNVVTVSDIISLLTLQGAIAVTGSRTYVASVARLSPGGETIGFVPGNNVAVIDIQTNAVSFVVLPGTVAAIAVTPDGSFVYAAIPGADSLSVIETEANTVVTN
jgi:DNA-binding beta-propeller fold protein YncE